MITTKTMPNAKLPRQLLGVGKGNIKEERILIDQLFMTHGSKKAIKIAPIGFIKAQSCLPLMVNVVLGSREVNLKIKEL